MRYSLGQCRSSCFAEFDHKSLKTTLLSPEAAPDQQLEFHRGCRGRSSTGNWRWPGSVRGAHTKRRGLCGRLGNVPALTYFKKTLWCATPFFPPSCDKYRRSAAGTCVDTYSHVQSYSNMFVFWCLTLLPNWCFTGAASFFLVKPRRILVLLYWVPLCISWLSYTGGHTVSVQSGFFPGRVTGLSGALTAASINNS